MYLPKVFANFRMITPITIMPNERMQSDQTTRYAPGLAADAGRYRHILIRGSGLEFYIRYKLRCNSYGLTP